MSIEDIKDILRNHYPDSHTVDQITYAHYVNGMLLLTIMGPSQQSVMYMMDDDGKISVYKKHDTYTEDKMGKMKGALRELKIKQITE